MWNLFEIMFQLLHLDCSHHFQEAFNIPNRLYSVIKCQLFSILHLLHYLPRHFALNHTHLLAISRSFYRDLWLLLFHRHGILWNTYYWTFPSHLDHQTQLKHHFKIAWKITWFNSEEILIKKNHKLLHVFDHVLKLKVFSSYVIVDGLFLFDYLEEAKYLL